MQIPDIPSEKELEFALFCIDYVARALEQDPTEIYQKLNESGLLENYFVKNYEVLHTLGKDYLVEDIINLMKYEDLL